MTLFTPMVEMSVAKRSPFCDQYMGMALVVCKQS